MEGSCAGPAHRAGRRTRRALPTQPLLDAGKMHVDDLLHRLEVGEFDIVEEAAAQKCVGQFLLIVGGDDDMGRRAAFTVSPVS